MADAVLDKLLRSDPGAYAAIGPSTDVKYSKASTADTAWHVPGPLVRLAAWAKTLLVLWASGLSAGLALLGLGVLAYLALTCALTPPVSQLVRPIYLDYTRPGGAVGVASLLTDEPYQLGTVVQGKVKAAHKAGRLLPPGQRVDVWVQLEMVDSYDRLDIFQVVGELLTSDGQVIAAFSRPCLTPHRSFMVRWLRAVVYAPLTVLGLTNDHMEMWVPLFHNHRERADAPFTVFRARLMARAGGGVVPPVYSASVHVKLHMGILKHLLYLVRPGTALVWGMAFVALATVTGAGTAAILFFYIWLYHAARGSGAAAAAKGGKASLYSGSSADFDDDALSDESSLSDVGSEISDSDDESPLSVAGASLDSLTGAHLEADQASLHGISPPASLLTDRSHLSGTSERTLPYAPYGEAPSEAGYSHASSSARNQAVQSRLTRRHLTLR